MFLTNLRHPGLSSVAFVLKLSEPFVLILCSILAYQVRVGFTSEMASSPFTLTVLGAVLYSTTASMLRLYNPSALRNMLIMLPRLLSVIVLVFATLLLLLFLFKISSQFSRVWLGLWFGSTLITLIALRWWVRRFIKTQMRQGRWLRKVAILGSTPKALELIDLIKLINKRELKLVGVYSATEQASTGFTGKMANHSYNFETLLEHGRNGLIDDVIIAEDLESFDNAEALLTKLHMLTVNVAYCLPVALIGRVSLEGLPVVMVFKKPLEGHAIWLKRALDILASGSILALVSPVMLGAAVLVKVGSPGPVFFRQKRGGFNGDEFEMLKFRSMRVGAEAMRDKNGKELQARKNDPRVTWIGRILRKTSLDELPQLLNVLRGDMSLVGPRPHVPSHNTYYEKLIDSYVSRHKMKPGLTGWAQLNGWRGETETLEKMVKRVEYDIWYTENWSLWLDIKIIFLTPFVTVFQRTAY